LIGDDVGGLDDAALVSLDAEGARRIAGVLDHQALDVENDVGDVLDDAGDGADLVLHALDLDARDGAAFQAGQQDTAQTVADGDAEAGPERSGDELAVRIGQRRAIAHNAVWQFQATPSNSHVLYSPLGRAATVREWRLTAPLRSRLNGTALAGAEFNNQ